MMLNLPVAVLGQRCPRGLHIAPWQGPNGELVILAMKSTNRLAAPPMEIPWGADSVAMVDALQELLDASDPPLIRLVI